ncbi:transglycosylase domain-containing protein [Marinibaculum pumilum]|uniref:peptidoglycan glycosyltransferase n=1 Tax=Marinibaculum pumilum TaxID=1766165 RepID=A0ABV7L887_9PROT
MAAGGRRRGGPPDGSGPSGTSGRPKRGRGTAGAGRAAGPPASRRTATPSKDKSATGGTAKRPAPAAPRKADGPKAGGRKPTGQKTGERGGGAGGRRRAAGTAPRDRRRRGFGRLLLKWGIVASVWLAVAALALLAWFAYDLPRTSELLAAASPSDGPAVVVTGDDGTVLARYGALYGAHTPLDAMAPRFVEAVLATEDRRFFQHPGIDPVGVARALAVNIWAGRIVQGGSTITQQLAKNLFLEPDRTLRRKVQEAMLAVWLELQFDKRQILDLYLNRVYFGAGAYGVGAAAARYFGKLPADLDLAESAMLAGLLKAPSRWAPTGNLAGAQARADAVLENMVEAGFIDRAAARAAAADPARPIAALGETRGVRYFTDWVLEELQQFVGRHGDDLIVRTSLDPRLQAAAERAVREGVAAAANRDVGQAALVAMRPDGAVLAMVGGTDHARSAYNRATQALRQPGSVFKPFVYLAALEAGYAPDDLVADAPLTVGGWQPENYDGRYRGEITLTEALAGSVNAATVALSEAVGRDKVVEAAQRLGISAAMQPLPAIALGAAEATLLELTTAYAVFASGGQAVLPYAIAEVRRRDGSLVYERSGSGLGRLVAGEDAAEMTAMLRAVVDRGTGRAARLDRPVAGKTGTSSDYRDAWFIGYTAALVAGVWTGNDDGRPMEGVTGGSVPAGIWQDFMSRAGS